MTLDEKTRRILEAMKTYIEEMEVKVEWEWGRCRELEEIKKDGDMPELYRDVTEVLQNAEVSMSEERTNCLEPSGSRCIVNGCINHRHQGRFIGDMCAPCHKYITTGKVGPTTSFLSRIDVLRTIAVSDWKTAGELRKMARDAVSSENKEIGK